MILSGLKFRCKWPSWANVSEISAGTGPDRGHLMVIQPSKKRGNQCIILFFLFLSQ